MSKVISNNFYNVTTIVWIYFYSFLHFRLPYRRIGNIVYNKTWNVHFDVISTDPIVIESYIMKELTHYNFIAEKKNEFEKTELDEEINSLNRTISELFKSSISLELTIKGISNTIYFKELYLQNYSDWKIQTRNDKIDKLFN